MINNNLHNIPLVYQGQQRIPSFPVRAGVGGFWYSLRPGIYIQMCGSSPLLCSFRTQMSLPQETLHGNIRADLRIVKIYYTNLSTWQSFNSFWVPAHSSALTFPPPLGRAFNWKALFALNRNLIPPPTHNHFNQLSAILFYHFLSSPCSPLSASIQSSSSFSGSKTL